MFERENQTILYSNIEIICTNPALLQSQSI
nr:unnamed protein product [Callosobruchus chinensis]CAH7722425.1 unnamed protein product [Callosobruchus chinensis]